MTPKNNSILLEGKSIVNKNIQKLDDWWILKTNDRYKS